MKYNRLLGLLTLGTALVLPAQANTHHSLLIRNVHIISADAQVSKQPLNVLIEQEHIRTIGAQAFSADEVIDGEGRYLIPGLIDTHVHLRDVPGLMADKEHSAIYQQAVAQIPKSYLDAGFTTLLDLANTRQAIDQWNSQPLAPQAYFCVPILIPKGYPVANLPESAQTDPDVARHYLDDRHSHNNVTITDANQHTPTKLVEAGKKDGASCIKVFYEKGFGGKKNLPVPSEKIVRELVKAAHQKNLPVFLHGNSKESYEFALATGVDMVAHGLWNADASTTTAELKQIANRMINANISVQPTVQVIYGEQELFNPNFFQQEAVKHVMPASLIQWYQSDEGQWMKREMSSYFKNTSPLTSEQQFQQIKTAYQPMLERVNTVSRQLNTPKSLLVFGSDTPSGPIYTQFPGLNGRMEMDRWLEIGVSLKDLFKAMTINNAKKMGLSNEIGSVEKSKIANLLLLHKNPLEDVSAYDSIDYVILKGKAIKREELSASKN